MTTAHMTATTRRLFMLLLVALAVAGATRLPAQAPADVRPAPIAIGFEFITRHIMIPVSVNGGKPLAFVLDTGDQVGIVDLERARAMSLTLDREVKIGGVGSDRLTGYIIKGATFGVPGLAGFSQPIAMALPLRGLASRFGHDFDGIIGSDFIREFVVEIDYEARFVRLHDPNAFTYSGSGEAVPITLDSLGHPIVEATVTPVGGQPITGKYVVDIGSSGALSLHSPFVTSHALVVPDKTIRAIGVGGAGGESNARLGRVAAFRIGNHTLTNPAVLFALDKAGAFANPALHGNIGNQIVGRFKLFLDYRRSRLILEPTARTGAPFDRAVSGIALEASGLDYTTFTIFRVLESSPASEAGLQVGDVIAAVNGRQAADLTMTTLQEMFEQAASYTLTIRRAGQTQRIVLTPRVMF